MFKTTYPCQCCDMTTAVVRAAYDPASETTYGTVMNSEWNDAVLSAYIRNVPCTFDFTEDSTCECFMCLTEGAGFGTNDYEPDYIIARFPKGFTLEAGHYYLVVGNAPCERVTYSRGGSATEMQFLSVNTATRI